MGIHLTVFHESQKLVRRADTSVKVICDIIWINVNSFALEVCFTHLGQRPGRGCNHALKGSDGVENRQSKNPLIMIRLNTLAPSLARSHNIRPFKNLRLVPCFPSEGHRCRLNRLILDQWSALRSRMRERRTSNETPRNSCPTITSGSALWIATKKHDRRENQYSLEMKTYQGGC